MFKWIKSLFNKGQMYTVNTDDLNEKQYAKFIEVIAMFNEVMNNVKNHLKNDNRVLQLDPLEFILGTTTVMHERKVQEALNQFMLTGEVPNGPIGETIKKEAYKLQEEVNKMFPKNTTIPTSSKPRILTAVPKSYNDLDNALKDFDEDDDNKVRH